MPPLSFTAQQMDRLTHAASLLPQHYRDGFLRSVANLVGSASDPAELEVAINFALNHYGVIGGNHAFQRSNRKRLLRLVRQT